MILPVLLLSTTDPLFTPDMFKPYRECVMASVRLLDDRNRLPQVTLASSENNCQGLETGLMLDAAGLRMERGLSGYVHASDVAVFSQMKSDLETKVQECIGKNRIRGGQFCS